MTATIVFSLIALAITGRSDAQEAATPASEPKQASIDIFRNEATEYQITLSDGRKPELNPTPILKWTNEVREGQDGALFVWMLDERPQVIGCVFTYHYREQARRKHQFHSLAMAPMTARIAETAVWNPQSAGLQFAVIPDAGIPETDAAKQKLQMRRLSRRFAADIDGEKEGSSELRLMPTPLLTYRPQTTECLAGGIFAFASGTDPDLLLVLEIRTIDQKPLWCYGFARFHYCRLTASLDGTQVWEAPQQLAMKLDRRESSDFRESAYVTFRTQ